MKGLVWHGKHDLRLEDVSEPRCGDGEALLEVKYAGICGSDLTIYQGKHKRAKPPTVLGHEFSGVVVERRGEGYPGVRAGHRVAVNPVYSCGQCELCLAGNGHICEKKGLYGVDSDGGFARYVKVALRAPIRLPEWASFEEGVLVETLAVAVRYLSQLAGTSRTGTSRAKKSHASGHGNPSRCDAAKAERQRMLDRVGLNRTYELLSWLDGKRA